MNLPAGLTVADAGIAPRGAGGGITAAAAIATLNITSTKVNDHNEGGEPC